MAPKVAEVQLTKDVGGAAAAAQLGYLAQVIDTGGWASRGVVNPTVSMNDAVYEEAQQAEDVLDENTNISRTFDTMIDKTTDEYKNSLREQFQQKIAQPAPQHDDQAHTSDQPAAQPQSFITSYPSQYTQANDDQTQTAATTQDTPHLDYDPYPREMHQHVLNPISDNDHSYQPTYTTMSRATAPTKSQDNNGENNSATNTSLESVSPDIMRLANNNDLSISAIANEAHRLEVKDNEEVVINLH